MSNGKEYLFYEVLLKGSYVKGANALEGMMRNREQAEETTGSDAAMSVIFEPMTNGGRRLLPDAFFGGSYLVGAGLRRYIRLTQSDFDNGDILGGHDTLGEIVADTELMKMMLANAAVCVEVTKSNAFLTAMANDIDIMSYIMANNVFTPEMLDSAVFMNTLAGNATVMSLIAESRTALLRMTDSVTAMSAIENSPAARSALANSTLKTTAAYPLTTTRTVRREGRVFIISVRSAATGTYTLYQYDRIVTNSYTSCNGVTILNTDYGLNQFYGSIDNYQYSGSATGVSISYTFIPLE